MAKAKEIVVKVLEVSSAIKVELVNIRVGIDYISHKFGTTKFENGFAEVGAEVATELRECGLVK